MHSFSCLNERYPVQYEQRRHRTGTSGSHTSNIAPERLEERDWCPKSQSSLPTPETASPFSSQWVPVLAPIHSLPLRSEYMFTPDCEIYPICNDPLSSLGSARRSLRFVTKIPPKALYMLLCVNRNPTRYGFHAGEKSYPVL